MVHSRESHLKINDLCSDTPEDGNEFRKIDAEGHSRLRPGKMFISEMLKNGEEGV